MDTTVFFPPPTCLYHPDPCKGASDGVLDVVTAAVALAERPRGVLRHGPLHSRRDWIPVRLQTGRRRAWNHALADRGIKPIAGIAHHFADPSVRKSIEVDLALLERFDTLIADLALTIVRYATQHDADAFHRLRSVPGIGKVLTLTILGEIHDITRFARVQELASYARLVSARTSPEERSAAPAAPRDRQGRPANLIALIR